MVSETQQEFSVPSPHDGRRTMPKEHGIEVMKALSCELFPTKHDAIRNHAKFCNCYPCLEYYGEL